MSIKVTEKIEQMHGVRRGGVIRQIFNREFLLSVIIPIIILAVFSHFNITLRESSWQEPGRWRLAPSSLPGNARSISTR